MNRKFERKMGLVSQIAMVCLVALSLSTIVKSQSATATLSGTVVDEQGAAISGATVVVRDEARVVERRTVSTVADSYTFTQLAPSQYTILVEMSGFSSIELKNVELNAADHQHARQETLVNVIGIISPAILMQKVMADVAGTGASRHKHFVRQFDDYVRKRNEYFSDKIFAGQTVGSADIEALPKFIFREETPQEILTRTALPLSVLLLISFGLCYLAIRRF